MKRNAISLVCENSSTPGLSWEAAVEFRPSKEGTEIWKTHDDDQKNLKKYEVIHEAFHWKVAASWLRKRVDPLTGESLLADVQVYGVCDEVADILKLCWVVSDERNNEPVLNFLLSLDAPETQYLWSANQSFISGKALTLIEEISDFTGWESIGIKKFNIKQIVVDFDLKKIPAPDELIDKILEKIDAKEPKINGQEKNKATKYPSSITPASKNNPIFKGGWIFGSYTENPKNRPSSDKEE